jgi:hypothetical protein
MAGGNAYGGAACCLYHSKFKPPEEQWVFYRRLQNRVIEAEEHAKASKRTVLQEAQNDRDSYEQPINLKEVDIAFLQTEHDGKEWKTKTAEHKAAVKAKLEARVGAIRVANEARKASTQEEEEDEDNEEDKKKKKTGEDDDDDADGGGGKDEEEEEFMLPSWEANELLRKKAISAGLIRPFMVLVSMGVRQRMKVAAALQMYFPEMSCFGDPHAEAWAILASPFKGLQDRATEYNEKLNKRDRKANW